jgi:hypothetical protein
MNRRSLVSSLGLVALWLGLACVAVVLGMFSAPLSIAAIFLAKRRQGKAFAASLLIVSLISTITVLSLVWHQHSIGVAENISVAAVMLDSDKQMRESALRFLSGDEQAKALAILDNGIDAYQKLLDGVVVTPELIVKGNKKLRDDMRRSWDNPTKPQAEILAHMDEAIDNMEKLVAAGNATVERGRVVPSDRR